MFIHLMFVYFVQFPFFFKINVLFLLFFFIVIIVIAVYCSPLTFSMSFDFSNTIFIVTLFASKRIISLIIKLLYVQRSTRILRLTNDTIYILKLFTCNFQHYNKTYILEQKMKKYKRYRNRNNKRNVFRPCDPFNILML